MKVLIHFHACKHTESNGHSQLNPHSGETQDGRLGCGSLALCPSGLSFLSKIRHLNQLELGLQRGWSGNLRLLHLRRSGFQFGTLERIDRTRLAHHGNVLALAASHVERSHGLGTGFHAELAEYTVPATFAEALSAMSSTTSIWPSMLPSTSQ